MTIPYLWEITMLQLLQIIRHMLVNLEYTPKEVEETFQALSNNELSINELLHICNIEPYSPFMMQNLIAKQDKWRSALSVTMLVLDLK